MFEDFDTKKIAGGFSSFAAPTQAQPSPGFSSLDQFQPFTPHAAQYTPLSIAHAGIIGAETPALIQSPHLQIPMSVAATNINLIKLVIQSNAGYNQMGYRPMTWNHNPVAEQRLATQLERDNMLLPSSVASAAGVLIQPSASSQGVIPINHGWGIARDHFVAIFEIAMPMTDARTVEIIWGYMDYKDDTLSGRLDPNCPMHVTHTVRVNLPRIRGERGIPLRYSDVAVLSPVTQQFDPQAPSTGITYTTPKGMSDAAIYSSTLAGVSRDWQSRGHHTANTVITADRVGAVPEKINPAHTTSAGWMLDAVTALNAGVNATVLDSIGGNVTGEPSTDVFQRNATAALEAHLPEAVWRDPVLATISGTAKTAAHSTLTLSSLRATFPYLDSKIQELNSTVGAIQDTKDGISTTEGILQSQLAVAIHAGLADLAIKSTLTSVSFSYDNSAQVMAHMGRPAVAQIIGDVGSFLQGLDIQPLLKAFEENVKNVLMPSVLSIGTDGTGIHYCKCVVKFNLHAATRIAMEDEYGHQYLYVFPSMCGAMITPVVNPNPESVGHFYGSAYTAVANIAGAGEYCL